MSLHLMCPGDTKWWIQWNFRENSTEKEKKWNKKIASAAAQKIRIFFSAYPFDIRRTNLGVFPDDESVFIFWFSFSFRSFFAFLEILIWQVKSGLNIMLEIHYFKVVLLLISSIVGIRTSWQENVLPKLLVDMGMIWVFYS